jgi:HD-like signal output (HDOD) protein
MLSKVLKHIEEGYNLPSLSPLAVRLVELASDENSSAKDLVKVIAQDPSLSARLLKLANSAYLGRAQPSTTLHQAVVRVGFNRLRIMALSISLRDTFPMGKVGPLDYEAFWRTSLYRGIMAKSLSAHLKTCNPGEAFVAGLILEIGVLVFFDLFIKERRESFNLELEPMEELLSHERELFGADHRQIGELVLKQWKFPDDIITCQQMWGQAALTDHVPDLVRLVEVARTCSQSLLHDPCSFLPLFDGPIETLGLDQEAVNDMIVNTFDQVQEVADCMAVGLTSEKDLMSLMEKANRVLNQLLEKLPTEPDQSSDNIRPCFDSLDQENDTIKQTLQAVAHEIRNPLVTVGGFARRLAETLDPGSEGGQYARIILEEAQRLEAALRGITLNHFSSSA